MSDKQHAWGEGTSESLTAADVHQIIQGIEEFIIAGDDNLVPVWQPYIDKLTTLRAALVQAEAVR